MLVGYGVGHLVTAAMFWGWPEYFLLGTGPVPPWPLSALQFGSWPPLHQGFLQAVGGYDVAVAVALFVAAANPRRHRGILVFAVTLFAVHGGVHAYHILWGASPEIYWWSVGQLWVGAAAIGLLWPRRA